MWLVTRMTDAPSFKRSSSRYRILEREITDPVASGFLHDIVLELEDDLEAMDCSGR